MTSRHHPNGTLRILGKNPGSIPSIGLRRLDTLNVFQNMTTVDRATEHGFLLPEVYEFLTAH